MRCGRPRIREALGAGQFLSPSDDDITLSGLGGFPVRYLFSRRLPDMAQVGGYRLLGQAVGLPREPRWAQSHIGGRPDTKGFKPAGFTLGLARRD